MLLSLAAVGIIATVDLGSASFEAFVARFGKRYATPVEWNYRRRIYASSIAKIASLNAAHTPRTLFAVNEFADMTPSEFASSRLLRGIAPRDKSSAPTVWNAVHAGSPPPNKNWYLSATTPVRNQGRCGSCWAFSTVEQVESDWYLSGKSGWTAPEELSTQELIDCDASGAQGCFGTYAGGGSGYAFIVENGGLASEAAYPDVSNKTGKSSPCRRRVPNSGGRITNYSFVIKPCDLPWEDCDHQDEDGLARYIGQAGPVSICVNANNWQFYSRGILFGATCGGHDHASLDHCVQIVGYSGYDASKGAARSGAAGAYWTVRNSWGAAWGDDGLIHLAMGNNTCGIADVPSFAVVTP